MVGVFLGWGLTEVSTRLRGARDAKERFILTNAPVRQQAYANLYASLNELQYYFRGFMNIKSEFIERSDPAEFAPLSSYNDFEKSLKSNEIWIHEESKKILDEIADSTHSLCNLGIETSLFKIRNEPIAEYVLESIESESSRMYRMIAEAKKHIRYVNGLFDFDKHNSNIVLNKAP